jgi:hypothetical protein
MTKRHKFKSGDVVPSWILKADPSDLQDRARFGVDVEVFAEGDIVHVYPRSKYETFFASRRAAWGLPSPPLVIFDNGLKDSKWSGAPTHWHNESTIIMER